MKVLHVIDSMGVYGAERVILNLMESQIIRGLQTTLLSIGDVGVGIKPLEAEANRRGINTLTIRFRNGLNMDGAVAILHSATEGNFDIIHSHGYKGNILLSMLPRKARYLPVITTLHGWTGARLFSKIGWYDLFSILSLKRLDKVVVVSSNMLNDYRMRTFRIRPTVINNGLPKLDLPKGYLLEKFPDLAKKTRGKLLMLSVARLSREKGLDVLIKSLKELTLDGLDFLAIIAGEGREKASLERLSAKLNLQNRIHFIGYMNDAYRLIPDVDLFVLPSRTEGLPITILEAMQAGVPIVSTRVGDVPLLLENGKLGWLVLPEKPSDLAKAIHEVYSNTGQALKKAALAQRKALNDFRIEKMEKAYFQEYNKLL